MTLLSAGAKIHEYQPTMYQCKVLIGASLMVSLGQTDFDTRSVRLNNQANPNIYSADFARRKGMQHAGFLIGEQQESMA